MFAELGTEHARPELEYSGVPGWGVEAVVPKEGPDQLIQRSRPPGRLVLQPADQVSIVIGITT